MDVIHGKTKIPTFLIKNETITALNSVQYS